MENHVGNCVMVGPKESHPTCGVTRNRKYLKTESEVGGTDWGNLDITQTVEEEWIPRTDPGLLTVVEENTRQNPGRQHWSWDHFP